MFDGYKKIEGWLLPEEATFLHDQARKAKGEIVEIGAFKGKSTWALASGAVKSDNKVFSIDHFIGSPEHGDGVYTLDVYARNLKPFIMSGTVTPIVCKSETAWNYLKSPVDFLFIDGNHNAPNPQNDFETYSVYLQKSGVVAFHDFGNPEHNAGVIPAVEAAKERGYEPLGVFGTIWAGVKT